MSSSGFWERGCLRERRTGRAWVLGALLKFSMLLGVSPVVAQTITGSVIGTVTDTSGAVISGANVTATNNATGVATHTVSDKSGNYNIRFLPIGPYTITASAAGFETASIGPFNLEIDQTAKIDEKLQVGSSSTTVKVLSDTSPILQTQDATLGTTITAHAIENLPLNGQNVTMATVLLPGAVLPTLGTLGSSYGIERDTSFGEAVPSFNGNRQQGNDYILDGVDINEPIINAIGYNPAPESLQQMRVLTGNANAEYGNVNGGGVIMVTKGGTNKFHGSAYEFFQNDSLAANTWANNFSGAAKSVFFQNQYGATIGGPILKNKLFFFGDYEGARYNTNGPGTASVATAQMRTGNFSQILAVKGIQLYNTQNGFTPYVNNQIPINNPAAAFLFSDPSVYPLPNKAPTDGVDQNNYLGVINRIIRNNQGDVRVDYNLDRNDAIMGRYTIGDAYDVEPEDVLATNFPISDGYPFQSFVTNWVHTFSPSLVNEFRAGYTRVVWNYGVPTDPSGVFGLSGNSKVGIPFPNQSFPGFSLMSFTGAIESHVGAEADIIQFHDNDFDYGDDLTWEHGKHIAKFGVQILRYQQNFYYPGGAGALGEFAFSGQYTGNPTLSGPGYSFADFVLNESNSASRGGDVGPFGQRQYRDAFYAQDDWKFRPNLTLNIGLRYGYDQPMYEVNNKQVNVNLSDPSLGTAGLEYAGQDGNSRALYNPVYTEFMPRVGFAYQANARTVIRGGYGITDAMEGTGTNFRLTENPPFSSQFNATATVPTATSGGSPLAVTNGFTTSHGGIVVPTTIYRSTPKNFRPTIIQEFNLTMQFLLSNHTSAQLGYVGELGQHLIDPVQLNQLPAPCTASTCTNAPFYNLVGQTGTLDENQSEGTSNYNALQAVFHHEESDGLAYTVNYTWAKSMTNSAGGWEGVAGVDGPSSFWQNIYDPRGFYGVSDFDVRNAINSIIVYQLPFGHGARFGSGWDTLTNEALGGWNISGDAVLYSGFPITMGSPNNANVNSAGELANQYLPLRIVHRGVQNWFGTDPSAVPCQGAFNGTCAYGVELPNTFGTAHIGTERAPGFRQIDLSVFKAFQIKSSQSVQFRADAFNAFNLASYGAPNDYIPSSTYGQITSTLSPPRQIQFSADYKF